ncbi:methionine synthase [Nocardioides sp. Bht2]|uniref:methionine synthase n=1 Tax=Nocardioides sp. Bht2 TaxID=3392297 RepID=UPI0039B4BD77
MSLVVATGIGSMPGGEPLAAEEENAVAFTEALRVVLGELPDLAHLPELPGRGAIASMTGRGVAVLAELAADLQPAGWRLTSSPGIDQRRARSLLARDLDILEELAQDYDGAFKVQLIGPWTLAATVEKPRGDKVLSDHGARRELAESLAEGLTDHVADLRRRLPSARELIVQIDEPALPAVLAGQIPTASGYGRHRAVHPPEASAALEQVLGAVSAAGAVPIVHCCAPEFPVELVRGAGARGVAVDLTQLDAVRADQVAEAIEAGERVLLGAVGSTSTGPAATKSQAVERVSRFLDMLGLDPIESMAITPTCGLAGADPTWVRESLRACREAAATF